MGYWRKFLCKLSKTPRHLPSKHSSWWRRLSSSSSEDIFKMFWSRRAYWPYSYVFKTSSRRLQNVFKTSSRRFQDVFKTPSRRLGKMSLRRLQDVSWSYTVLANIFQDAFKAYSQRFWGVPQSRVSTQKDLPWPHFLEIMVNVQNLQEWEHLSSFICSLYYTF